MYLNIVDGNEHPIPQAQKGERACCSYIGMRMDLCGDTLFIPDRVTYGTDSQISGLSQCTIHDADLIRRPMCVYIG